MSTVAEMFESVLSDINREDKAPLLPKWLRSAENRINLILRDERMTKHAINPLEDYIFPLPPDFVAHKSIGLRKGVAGTPEPGEVAGTLRYIPEDQIMTPGLVKPPYPGNQPGWYTTRGREVEIGIWNSAIQSGAAGFQVDMWYYAELDPPLVANEDHNWFSDKYPQVYEDMIKYFAFKNLQEHDTADKCLMAATTEIGVLNAESEKQKAGAGPLIMRPARRFGGRYS